MIFSFFFFKQKSAYEMRISDWSSDVCSSDLVGPERFCQKRLNCVSTGGRWIVVEDEFAPGEELAHASEVAIIDQECVARHQIGDGALMAQIIWHAIHSALGVAFCLTVMAYTRRPPST